MAACLVLLVVLVALVNRHDEANRQINLLYV